MKNKKLQFAEHRFLFMSAPEGAPEGAPEDEKKAPKKSPDTKKRKNALKDVSEGLVTPESVDLSLLGRELDKQIKELSDNELAEIYKKLEQKSDGRKLFAKVLTAIKDELVSRKTLPLKERFDAFLAVHGEHVNVVRDGDFLSISLKPASFDGMPENDKLDAYLKLQKDLAELSADVLLKTEEALLAIESRPHMQAFYKAGAELAAGHITEAQKLYTEFMIGYPMNGDPAEILKRPEVVRAAEQLRLIGGFEIAQAEARLSTLETSVGAYGNMTLLPLQKRKFGTVKHDAERMLLAQRKTLELASMLVEATNSIFTLADAIAAIEDLEKMDAAMYNKRFGQTYNEALPESQYAVSPKVAYLMQLGLSRSDARAVMTDNFYGKASTYGVAYFASRFATDVHRGDQTFMDPEAQYIPGLDAIRGVIEEEGVDDPDKVYEFADKYRAVGLYETAEVMYDQAFRDVYKRFAVGDLASREAYEASLSQDTEALEDIEEKCARAETPEAKESARNYLIGEKYKEALRLAITAEANKQGDYGVEWMDRQYKGAKWAEKWRQYNDAMLEVDRDWYEVWRFTEQEWTKFVEELPVDVITTIMSAGVASAAGKGLAKVATRKLIGEELMKMGIKEAFTKGGWALARRKLLGMLAGRAAGFALEAPLFAEANIGIRAVTHGEIDALIDGDAHLRAIGHSFAVLGALKAVNVLLLPLKGLPGMAGRLAEGTTTLAADTAVLTGMNAALADGSMSGRDVAAAIRSNLGLSIGIRAGQGLVSAFTAGEAGVSREAQAQEAKDVVAVLAEVAGERVSRALRDAFPVRRGAAPAVETAGTGGRVMEALAGSSAARWFRNLALTFTLMAGAGDVAARPNPAAVVDTYTPPQGRAVKKSLEGKPAAERVQALKPHVPKDADVAQAENGGAKTRYVLARRASGQDMSFNSPVDIENPTLNDEMDWGFAVFEQEDWNNYAFERYGKGKINPRVFEQIMYAKTDDFDVTDKMIDRQRNLPNELRNYMKAYLAMRKMLPAELQKAVRVVMTDSGDVAVVIAKDALDEDFLKMVETGERKELFPPDWQTEWTQDAPWPLDVANYTGAALLAMYLLGKFKKTRYLSPFVWYQGLRGVVFSWVHHIDLGQMADRGAAAEALGEARAKTLAELRELLAKLNLDDLAKFLDKMDPSQLTDLLRDMREDAKKLVNETGEALKPATKAREATEKEIKDLQDVLDKLKKAKASGEGTTAHVEAELNALRVKYRDSMDKVRKYNEREGQVKMAERKMKSKAEARKRAEDALVAARAHVEALKAKGIKAKVKENFQKDFDRADKEAQDANLEYTKLRDEHQSMKVEADAALAEAQALVDEIQSRSASETVDADKVDAKIDEVRKAIEAKEADLREKAATEDAARKPHEAAEARKRELDGMTEDQFKAEFESFRNLLMEHLDGARDPFDTMQKFVDEQEGTVEKPGNIKKLENTPPGDLHYFTAKLMTSAKMLDGKPSESEVMADFKSGVDGYLASIKSPRERYNKAIEAMNKEPRTAIMARALQDLASSEVRLEQINAKIKVLGKKKTLNDAETHELGLLNAEKLTLEPRIEALRKAIDGFEKDLKSLIDEVESAGKDLDGKMSEGLKGLSKTKLMKLVKASRDKNLWRILWDLRMAPSVGRRVAIIVGVIALEIGLLSASSIPAAFTQSAFDDELMGGAPERAGIPKPGESGSSDDSPNSPIPPGFVPGPLPGPTPRPNPLDQLDQEAQGIPAPAPAPGGASQPSINSVPVTPPSGSSSPSSTPPTKIPAGNNMDWRRHIVP